MVSQSRIWGPREEALSGLEGQLEVAGLELMAESIMADTHSKSRREKVPDFRSCNSEIAGAKWSTNEWSAYKNSTILIDLEQ